MDTNTVWLEIVKTVPIVLTIVVTTWLQFRKIDKNTEVTTTGFVKATEQGEIIHDAVNGNLAKVNKRLDDTTKRLDDALEMIKNQAEIIESMRIK